MRRCRRDCHARVRSAADARSQVDRRAGAVIRYGYARTVGGNRRRDDGDRLADRRRWIVIGVSRLGRRDDAVPRTDETDAVPRNRANSGTGAIDRITGRQPRRRGRGNAVTAADSRRTGGRGGERQRLVALGDRAADHASGRGNRRAVAIAHADPVAEGARCGRRSADRARGLVQARTRGQRSCRNAVLIGRHAAGRGVTLRKGDTDLGGSRRRAADGERCGQHGEAARHGRRRVPVGVAGLIRRDGACPLCHKRQGRSRHGADAGAVAGERDRQPRSGARRQRQRRRRDRGVVERGKADRLIALADDKALLNLRRRCVTAVSGLIGIDAAGADAGEGDGPARNRTDARTCRVDRERHGQARSCGCGGRIGGAAHLRRAGCGRRKADRLAAARYIETLLNLRCSRIVGIAGLVGVERAGAGAGEAHRPAADRADAGACRIHGEGDRQTRSRRRGGRIGRTAHRRRSRRRRGEADRLRAACDGEALRRLCSRIIVGVARLVGIDPAGTDAGKADDPARNRAHAVARRIHRKGDRQPRKHRRHRRVGRAPHRRRGRRRRTEADDLDALADGETLLQLRSRVIVGVAGLVRVHRAGAHADEPDYGARHFANRAA